MISLTKTNFNWTQGDTHLSNIVNDDAGFAALFATINVAHLRAVQTAWAKEAANVATDAEIRAASLWTDQDTTAMSNYVSDLADLNCGFCCLDGHEASYCPFNAQMNRICASRGVAVHALWKRWRIARSQFVQNKQARVMLSARSAASKARADAASAASTAAASAFQQ